jgi:asparagine synthase (glutamine-hydrolysing)
MTSETELHGVGGLVRWESGQRIEVEWLRGMAARVSGEVPAVHAGPDPAGVFAAGTGAHLEVGPRVWVVADMDLLNAAELAGVVGSEGLEAGLLSSLYTQEGPAFVRRLRGAFAIVLWDRRERQLLLAGDHFGMRRLYYMADARGVTFATRIGAILAAPGVEKSIDPTAIYRYLNFHFVPAPATPYARILRLPPAHVLVARKGLARLEPFWDLTYRENAVGAGAAARKVYELTQAAVATSLANLTAKGSGAFLSGGTDSSTIVGLMARLGVERVNAFSVGFSEERYDELDYARVAAHRFAARHHTRVVSPRDALDAIPALVEAYEEPFGNNSAIGTFLCARLARENGVRCLLAGDGGDEIFGGNERYRTDRIFARYHRLPRPLREQVLEPVLRALPEGSPGVLGKAQRYVRRANLGNPRRFYSYEFFVAQNAAELLTPEFVKAAGVDTPWETLERHFERVSADAELNRLMYLDLKLTIGDDDLFKVTRTAELAGIGVRFPMLDVPLVEFTATLPAEFKVRGLEKRHLFKRAFGELLPAEILSKRKHGFGVPTSSWLKTDPGFRSLARETLHTSGGVRWSGSSISTKATPPRSTVTGCGHS